jgi:hypothetical protein
MIDPFALARLKPERSRLKKNEEFDVRGFVRV